MPDCYREGYERGLWYEIKCIAETIKGMESRGEDASFEKGILRAFKKCLKQRDDLAQDSSDTV